MSITQAYETAAIMLTLTAAQPPATQPPTPIPPTETSAPTVTSPAAPPSPTALPQPPTATQLPPPSPTPVCDRAAAGYPKIDVNVEDDTVMQPGQTFTKIWRLTNVGACSWTREYSVRFSHGDRMNALESVALSGNVASGQTVEIAVDMVAPAAPGTYRGNWKLQNPGGVLFGIGPNGDAPFWVQIVVEAPLTATPTQTGTPTATQPPTLTPTITPTPTATPVVIVSGAVTLPAGAALDLDTLQPNTGAGDDLAYVIDPTFNHLLMPQAGGMLGVYGSLPPTREACLAASMGTAPIAVESLSPGVYLCYRTNQGLPGWMRYSSLNLPDGSVTLDLLTWGLP